MRIMKLTILLILSIFAYTLNANWEAEKSHDIVKKDLAELRVEYNENKAQLSDEVSKKVQWIMSVYGTRLTLMEKAVKKHHNVDTLDDLRTKRN